MSIIFRQKSSQPSFEYQAQTIAYVNACPTLIPQPRKMAINTLVLDLKSSVNEYGQSIWDLTDKLGILANQSIDNAAINLKYPTLTTQPLGTLEYVNANPTMYETNKGILRNNVTNNHIYTRYQPDGTNNYKLTSSAVAVWALSLGGNYQASLATAASGGKYSILAYKVSDTRIRAVINNSSTGGGDIIATPTAGFLGATRTSSALIVYSQNGTESNYSQTGNVLAAGQFTLCGYYNYTSYFSIQPHSLYFIGGGLSAGSGGQLESLYLAWRKYLITMGVIS